MAILISKKVSDPQSWNLTWGLMENRKVCAPFEPPGISFFNSVRCACLVFIHFGLKTGANFWKKKLWNFTACKWQPQQNQGCQPLPTWQGKNCGSFKFFDVYETPYRIQNFPKRIFVLVKKFLRVFAFKSYFPRD